MSDKRKPWSSIPRIEGETPSLVGLVRTRRDWRLVRDERWYRIPKASAPEGIERIRYVAFYQGAPFGAGKYQVRYYAEVTGVSEASRVELLPQEPDHKRAGDLYYRIGLGELYRLPGPIPSLRWRRIVFIPTTLERLLRAQEINDLYCGSPIEDELHTTLKDAGLSPERQYLVRDGEIRYVLDFALFCREGRLDIECDGRRYHDREEADGAGPESRQQLDGRRLAYRALHRPPDSAGDPDLPAHGPPRSQEAGRTATAVQGSRL